MGEAKLPGPEGAEPEVGKKWRERQTERERERERERETGGGERETKRQKASKQARKNERKEGRQGERKEMKKRARCMSTLRPGPGWKRVVHSRAQMLLTPDGPDL